MDNAQDLITVGKGKYKIWWDEKLSIGRMVVVGECDEAMAQKISDWTKELLRNRKEGFAMLVDLSQNTKTTSAARKIFAELQHSHRDGTKTAFVGASTLVRITVNFIAGASGASDVMKHFASEADALAWLNIPPKK